MNVEDLTALRLASVFYRTQYESLPYRDRVHDNIICAVKRGGLGIVPFFEENGQSAVYNDICPTYYGWRALIRALVVVEGGWTASAHPLWIQSQAKGVVPGSHHWLS
jgi:hypothetical protein